MTGPFDCGAAPQRPRSGRAGWWSAVTSRSAIAVAGLAALGACNPQQQGWGFGAVANDPTPPDSPTLGCGVTLPADTLVAKRESCTFGTGALAEDTLGISPTVAAQIPIRHVIIMMKENRSFDQLFGHLSGSGQPNVAAVPSGYVNPDLSGAMVTPFHQTNTCLADDPTHQSDNVSVCMDDGRMDGFVRNAAATTGTDGHWAMGEYTAAELPFYYFLATTFAVSDQHFASMPTGTYANRNFLMFGSNAGVVDTGIVYAAPNTPSIMALLSNAGFTWGFYVDGAGSQPADGALNWSSLDPGVHPLTDLLQDLDDGTLPNVAFVDGKENIEDDHPDADLQVGEAWSRNIYQHLVASPQWMRSAMIFTYDEAGAFADHEVPPAACVIAPGWPWPQLGPRVPLIAISPWAKRTYASHVIHDHTAITRFIELLFHLPALTPRDANADALLDLFDFSCGRDLTVAAAPDAGTGDCVDPAPPGTD